MNVHVLASYDVISHYHFYPLFVLKNGLIDRDCHIRFHTKIRKGLFDCDVLLIDNRFFSPLWSKQSEGVMDALKDIRARCSKVIWMDVTDSTGTTQFQVMPYVDRYLKKQLLKDRVVYLKRFYNARIFADYYKKTYALVEEDVYSDEPIKEEFIPKLGLSWNMGLGPFHLGLKFNYRLRRIPFFIKEKIPYKYKNRFISTNDRKHDICFRGSDTYNNLALAYQRLEIIKLLKAKGISTQPLPRHQYLDELKDSKICISPFGSGEICFRDFEIILNGGMLLKPDMSHLETWPDIYIKDETYGALEWDLSNLDERLGFYLNNPDEINSISRQAQERYQSYFSDEGKDEFCKRFIGLMS